MSDAPADIVIVGAGAAGATLAAALAPQARVTVLEAEAQAGTQASARSAAVFVPAYGHGLLRALSDLSRPFFEAPDPAAFPAPLLSPRGMLRAVLPGGEEEHAGLIAGQAGIEEISPREAAQRLPILDPARLSRAAWEGDVHDIDADLLVQGALRQARAAGAEIRLRAPLTAARREGGAWVVEAGGERLRAEVLVDAAGAWAETVAARAGVAPLGLTPLRRSMAVIPRPARLEGIAPIPFTVTFPTRWYCKGDAAGLLVSPGDADPQAPHDAWPDDMVVAEGLARFAEDTGEEPKRLLRAWAGLRTAAPDGYPAVGFEPDAPGFFWLAGQEGFGVQCAPGLARLAAALIAGEGGFKDMAAAFAPGRLRR